MPISSTVAGKPSESFGKFSFTDVALSQITPAELAKFDTVALIQVRARSLSAAARSALAQFVANGGKLLIHDADETTGNNYTWLLPNSSPTQVGGYCNSCGLTSGSSRINQNTTLISANPLDPSYVNIPEMQKYTDAVGDANLLTSLDPRWFAAVTGTNAPTSHSTSQAGAGAQIAYAQSGSGLIIYNGFDTDMIMPTANSPWRCVMSAPSYRCPAAGPHEAVDWLAQMWYNELNQSSTPSAPSADSGSGGSSDPGLPATNPVSSIGTPLPSSAAGMPPAKACVARRTVFLRLRNLIRHHHQVVQIDVYVNGRHRLRESVRQVHVDVHGHRRLRARGRWHNVTLRHLPKKGRIVIKIVATTNRHYHLISKRRYHAC